MKEYQFELIEKCDMCSNELSTSQILGQRLNTSQGYNPKNKGGISVTIYKCSTCKLIYSSPMPIPINIQDHYGIPADDYWTPEYFEYTSNYFLPQITQVKELLSFKKGMKSLDIGAGIGKCMKSMEMNGFDAYGIEPSITFREKAIERLEISPDKLKLGMIETVSYAENEFDFVTFGAVLEHLYHPSDCISKALRWMKPGGIIHIEVPSSDYLIPKLFNLYFRLRGTNYVSNLSPMHEPFHLYEFGLESFEKNAEKEGYEIAYSSYDVCQIYFIPKIFHRIMRRFMKKTNTGMQLTVYLRKK